jgi:ribonuclease J
MNITIHRGTHQIGGSCVELACGGTRIIIDAGLPLAANGVQDQGVRLDVSGLFADAPDEAPVDALIISHAHQDHYGLLELVRQDVPVFMSPGTAKLVEISRLFGPHGPLDRPITLFAWREPFEVGPFRIVPHLVDHSGFDCYAFEVEAGGKRVFYSGDFRDHGPIPNTLASIRELVKPGVDALLMEGTMLGRADEEVLTEAQLAEEAKAICRDCSKAVFVYQSGQNVSRFVSFYKAAWATGRECVLDFYTAHVLTELGKLAGGAKLPRPGHPVLEGVSTWFPRRLTKKLKDTGRGDIPNRYARWKRKKEQIAEQLGRSMIFVRPGMESDIALMGDIKGSVLIYSLWEGYREDDRTSRFLKAVDKLGITVRSLHTSGHATIPALQRLVDMLQPGSLVPIHTEYPQDFVRFSVPVVQAEDGKPFAIGQPAETLA